MEKKGSTSLVDIIMKVDWKAIIALSAALLSAYAQYRAETARSMSQSAQSSISWTEHRINANNKGRKATFKELQKRIKNLETKACEGCND